MELSLRSVSCGLYACHLPGSKNMMMNSSNSMPHQDSDNVPVTFQDVAASFSDEEWTLLQRWQKELYQNVMKEIQQALHSLGPVIATHVFSLRTKEKEDLNPFEEADSETRHSDDEPSGPPSQHVTEALRESRYNCLLEAL
ncbi:zinc finger protein 777-like [Pleurodeles waltl]|uniref:zinc finger protein 777-like n=1 Tax=Pleurodeles waltl TaxID=8319 RepID=UPI0037097539